MTVIFGIISGIVITLILARVLTQWGLLKLYDARIAPNGIEFMIFNVRFYTLRFDNIQQVIRGYGGWRSLIASDFRNRFFEQCFLIVKKKGIFTRKILISPADSDSFIRAFLEANVSVKLD